MDSLLVPSSIQRIRAFLVEMCGMKVKPWATAEETLAALHATLVARQSCDIFWTSLRGLLETLARDLKTRQEAAPGVLIDNELLSPESYASLLEEIRACLARQQGGQVSSFRRLAQGLSAPALGLLLLLGGVTTVGCERSPLGSTGNTPDAALADAGPFRPDSMPAQPDARPDSLPDSTVHIVFPDAAPDTAPDAATAKNYAQVAPGAGPDGGTVTIQEIMDACGIPSDVQAEVLACLGSLQASWTTGIASYLAGKECSTVANDLRCDGGLYSCYRSGSSADFDPSQLPFCEPVLIYLGVRFV